MLCYVMLRYVMSCTVSSCPVLPCPVLSCPVLSCPVLSCPLLSCLVLFVSNTQFFHIYFIFSCRYFQLLDSTVGPPLKVITTSYLPANARLSQSTMHYPFLQFFFFAFSSHPQTTLIIYLLPPSFLASFCHIIDLIINLIIDLIIYTIISVIIDPIIDAIINLIIDLIIVLIINLLSIPLLTLKGSRCTRANNKG